jgi:hypothetical protein
MANKTVERVEFEHFLQEYYDAGTPDASESQISEQRERELRLAAFPYEVVLKLSYPEMDFANRWCWQQFGPASGVCEQLSSEYPACLVKEPHFHVGTWAVHWLGKTGYDCGFNEWRFTTKADQGTFLTFVPDITWGEKYENPAA